MTTINEDLRTAEFLISEGNMSISREEVTFAALAAPLEAGTVVGIVTASGHYAAYSNAESDGTQTAVGVLYCGLPISVGTQKGVIIARLAELAEVNLIGCDAAAKVDLATHLLIVR